jgi:hypothetical protein
MQFWFEVRKGKHSLVASILPRFIPVNITHTLRGGQDLVWLSQTKQDYPAAVIESSSVVASTLTMLFTSMG